ncbi:MAG: ABC transporter ATP-binding protein [Gammaproteobacteria bacterium]|nr:ABC transporter ATP-binding protein [Gammaproteobacteria bacterium]
MCYPGSSAGVFEALNFEVASGEFVAILGRSGSGKSTLLHLLGAMEQPTSGSLTIGGIKLDGLDDIAQTAFRRRHLGFVFQAYNLVPTLTVAENLRLPLDLNGIAEGDSIAQMLEALGLENRARRYPDQLSGGEQQRVAIGRALIHAPDLILADEPTGNLDAETSAEVLALLQRLVRTRRHTLIVATHSLDAARNADRIFQLDHGRLVSP